jgi:large subunit ribosomal protein L22
VGRARLRYLGTSAQKTRLVVDQIRGQQVDSAFAFLRHCKKGVAVDILKLLRSAVANTENGPEAAMLDTADLYVSRAQVDQGPSLKRIQPAPMGRAYPILKRQCHVTIELAARTRK